MKRITRIIVTLSLFFLSCFGNVASAADDNKVMDYFEKAYVAASADLGSEISYEMIVGGEVETFYTNNKSMDVSPGEFVSFKAHANRIVDFKEKAAVEAVREKVMKKDTAGSSLDLELTGTIKLAAGYSVYQILNGKAIKSSLSQVYVGAENVSVYRDELGNAFLLLIHGKTPINTMRIGINNSGFASLDHSQLDVQSADGFKLIDKKANQEMLVAPNTNVTFVSSDTGMKVTVNGSDLYTSANRLYAVPVSATSLLKINTFKRAYGNPSYRGVFEITQSETAGKLNLINEIQLEQYLFQVVPSEMPASFGLEALKAQSVAARTYALSDYFSNRYAKKGFHVDDSTMSQVYNNSAENAMTTQAVTETSGIIMESDGELVDARYYSTSGGYGASKHEVWADSDGKFPGTPISYLTARSYTFDPSDSTKLIQIDTSSEEQLNQFYKNLSYRGYDSESYYFRWKVAFTKAELANTINSQLPVRYAADPKAILTKDADGNFVSKPIPVEGAGSIMNMYVSKRGAGGNMMELVIEGTKGTFKILKEYNIRFTIRPSKTFTGNVSDVLLYRAKGGSTAYDLGFTIKNNTILPSAFATFDLTRDADGNLTSITFYGGGNGHGAGMSQYGASMLGSWGWSYDKILTSYYANMQLVDVYKK